jgi:molybdenum cofactor synthesis domain-containing protein
LKTPSVWIINIGTELTIGRIVNSNGAWLARELTLRGAKVKRIVCVPDEEEEVVTVLREALANADIVITTGGLGPTPDDRTAEFLAKAVGVDLVVNQEALNMVREKYEAVGLPLTSDRVKMAMLPRGAKPIPNSVGTAPGIHLEYQGKQVFALPGVPREMEAMFQNYVLKAIEPLLPRLCVVEESLKVEGVPESSLAPILREAQRLCADCYVKSHPMGEELGRPVIDVRVLASAPGCDEARAKARSVVDLVARKVKVLER